MELSLIFAKRLIKARKAHGYTQRALAEKIGYSEKAISKWECGGAIPPAEVLVDLAAVLHTTIGALLEAEGAVKYYLGIDGGGTKTAFLLEDEQGREIGALTLGSTNPNDVGMDTCLSRLREGILAVTAGFNLAEVAVFAGIAGGGVSGNNAVYIKKSLDGYGFGAVGNGSDAESLVELALHGGDGVAVIAGTGTVAFAQNGSTLQRVSGWGYLLDGGGSGYDLARDALSASLRHIDGRGEPTVLTAMLQEKLQKSVPDAIPEIYQGGKRYIAALAPVVYEAARSGDAVALAIFKRNAAALAETVLAASKLVEDRNAPVVICGGLVKCADILEPMIREMLPNGINLTLSGEEMVKGAVARARRIAHEQH